MINPRFIHLHVRSDYSMIDGLSKINELVDKSVSLGMPALALTDFSNLFGFIKFYNYSHQCGIKPIVGSDFLIQSSSYYYNDVNELTCLAINYQGYQNLIKLISQAYKYKSDKNFPIVQNCWLMEYSEGLIVLSGGRNGELGKYLLQNKSYQIEQCLSFYNKYFPNRYYIELMRTGRANEELYLELAIELSRIKGLPVVATNDVRFINMKNFQAHAVRVAIHNGLVVNKIKQSHKYSDQQFIKSEQEMCDLFVDIPESLVNSVEIAQRCNCIIKLGGSFLPNFPTGSMSSSDFLIKRAQEGLEDRLSYLFPKSEDRIIKRIQYDIRLQHELKVINQMGFPGYFLIVMEFIQWAKNNDIPVGPGRGSGASSLVAYTLKITELDPIKFDLLFERFLNPERISMPDLDIDFCVEHRDLVINHVADIYGSDSVSQIITFGTMAAKAAVRDVGRALGYSYSFVNRIAKLIPLELNITLNKACSTVEQLKSLYNSDVEVKELIDMAQQLEGIIRNVSKHAGGVVIAPNKIIDFSPLYYDKEYDHAMTQFDKDDIECIGLIKFDFLGLKTLTIIDRSLKMINTRRISNNLNIININTIPLDDKKSFCELQFAETTAVFQLESNGIKILIKHLQPDCFEDLIALIALFRPGPLQSGMVDNFIRRKHGYEPISYPDSQWEHESLRPVLESTYGIILYQEQVMQIAQILAGYTLGKADILRRAIGKKRSEDMSEQRSIFNFGAIRNGIDKILSQKIFDLMEKFAGYGFNKSHSAAYALISYQTLWLKTHYPAEFMASVLSSDMDNISRIIILLNECKRMGLTVLPPNINNSQYYFYVNDRREIVYGLGAIKGIGKSSIDSIVISRNNNGNFRGLFDFCIRMDNISINRRVIEKLIFSGSCDVFKISRLKLIISLNRVMKSAFQFVQRKNSKQIDMFTEYSKIHVNTDNMFNDCASNRIQWNNKILLEKEKEALGLYLTNHPINYYIREVEQYFSNIIATKDVLLKENNEIVYVFGLFVSIYVKLSKKGNNILFGILEDNKGRLEVIVFQELLQKYQHCLRENSIVLIKGIINFDKIHGINKIVAQKLWDINDIRKNYVRSLSIILYDDSNNEKLLHNIYSIFKKNSVGSMPIYFLYKMQGVQIRLCCGTRWYIDLTDQFLITLRSLIGHDRVKLELY